MIKTVSRGISHNEPMNLKKKINFKIRENNYIIYLKTQGKYGEFDCIVPSSGGKDSCYAAHILKFKYGMNPLTVTWPPIFTVIWL